MKKVVITGASGMIGGIILQHCLASDNISEVISIVRKYGRIKHPKLKEVILSNFLDYTSAGAYIINCDIAYFCIGVYTGTVTDDEFKKITVDYTKAFADAIKQNSPEVTLCFLSGQGADRDEKSKISFARYKGIAENYLFNKAFQQLYIFRPAYIYPVQKRKEPNLFYSSLRLIYPVVKKIIAKHSITSVQLGKAMFKAGLDGAHKTILENLDIKAICEP